MKICGIYGIFNTVNGKVYIGSSHDTALRWNQHKAIARREKHSNRYFQRAWSKYGEMAFEFRVLEKCPVQYLLPREDYWIAFHNSKNRSRGYNIQDACMVVFSDETRRRISEARKGAIITTATRRKMSRAHKGKKFSEEHRKRMGASQLGRHHSEESKRKIGLGHKGMGLTKETRDKISRKLTGKIVSKETRIKMSNAHKGKHLSKERKWVLN